MTPVSGFTLTCSFHHVAALGRADESRPDRSRRPSAATHVAGTVVVIDDLVRIRHPCAPGCYRCHSTFVRFHTLSRHLVERRHLAQAPDHTRHLVDHVSTSSSVLKRPRPNRNRGVGELVARARALSTYEGSRLADVHAEPEDTATFAHPMRSDSPSTYAKLTLRLFGSRDSSDPFTWISSSCAEPCPEAVTKAAQPGALNAHLLAADRRRFPEADDPGHVQRAGPHARSWPPPSMIGVTSTRGFLRRTYSAPTPLGPYILVRRERRQVHAHLVDIERHLPAACHRVRMEEDPARTGEAPDLGDRLDHAIFVVRHHDADQESSGP